MQHSRRRQVKIPSGAALSVHVDEHTPTTERSFIDLAGSVLVGIEMPAGWDAADITVIGSTDGGATSKELVDDGGTAVQFVVAANRLIPVDWAAMLCPRWLRLRSGTSGTPVNQTADRLIGLVVREQLT